MTILGGEKKVYWLVIRRKGARARGRPIMCRLDCGRDDLKKLDNMDVKKGNE